MTRSTVRSVLCAAWLAAIAMPAAAAVDVCVLLSKEDATALIGKLAAEPTAKPAQDSLLGQCDYSGADGTKVSVSAYPADELEGSVRYDRKKGRLKEVAGLGEKAYETSSGLMIQPAGTPYFLGVLAIRGAKGIDDALALAIGKKLKL